MTKKYIKLFSIVILFAVNQLSAQQKNHWSKIDEAKISNTTLQRKTNVKNYKTFQLDYSELKNNLIVAPKKNSKLKESNLVVKFPDEKGNMILFYVKESPVMHPDLAKKYPNNRSYVGVGVQDKSNKVRFSVNEQGLHAMITNKERKVQYIDPITNDNKYYKVYARKDMDFERNKFQCFTESIHKSKKSSLVNKTSNDLKLRTFRLALAGTGEYSQFHISAAGVGSESDAVKKAAVLSAMTTAMTRVNAVFENDLALTMQLVANNDDLIFLNANTDGYTNDDGSKMLVENQTKCDNVIGSNNYDIGHVFSTGGGGVAILASSCLISHKAKGVTGSSNPTGDNFYFDFVAHEMGHQFGANHTFNGDAGNCVGANRNDATAVEPGSGSTLMAYAGICSPQNVQSHSDLYFHIITIDEIWANITAGNSTCGTISNLSSNSNAPTVNAGQNFTIPKSTPYILDGVGNDADGDPVSFCWEQIDNQITAIPPSETATSGAIYRSLSPKDSGTRYMPELSTVVNGNVSSTWEVTPSVAREMNFKLTVRDNNSEAGQVNSDNLKVTVTNAAGPFKVTSQNTTNIVWNEGTNETITWDVAGTNGNGINVSNVNIFLSTDGGKTFPTTLKSNTPNDGSQIITVPNTPASNCFVMIRAASNFFYALNASSFSIGEFTEVCTIYDSTDIPKKIPDSDPIGVTSNINVTDSYTIENVKVSVKIDHTWVSDLTLTLESPNGTIIELLSGACDDGDNIDVEFDDGGGTISCSGNPVVSGTIKPTESLSQFIGETSNGTWKLKVVDGNKIDVGSLISWGIELCTSESLAINNYVFNQFKVFPNPSNGQFNVEFKSQNTSEVEIVIFDLMGRIVFKEKYSTNATSFKERVNIQNISSGIYVLQVKRGNEISSQKIHIN